MPGSPHKASIGMLAPRAMLTVTRQAQSSAVGDGQHVPGQDAHFAQSAGAGGGDVRQFVGFGQQAPRIAVDLGKTRSARWQDIRSVENHREQSQDRRRNAEKGAAQGDPLISYTGTRTGRR